MWIASHLAQFLAVLQQVSSDIKTTNNNNLILVHILVLKIAKFYGKLASYSTKDKFTSPVVI